MFARQTHILVRTYQRGAARMASSSTGSMTPIEDAVRSKITEALKPTSLTIHNDSHLHSHHKAMVGSTSKETHFRIEITSEAFTSKMQPARHRLVYSLLKDEMSAEGGIHALQLRTRTPAEEARQGASSGSTTAVAE